MTCDVGSRDAPCQCQVVPSQPPYASTLTTGVCQKCSSQATTLAPSAVNGANYVNGTTLVPSAVNGASFVNRTTLAPSAVNGVSYVNGTTLAPSAVNGASYVNGSAALMQVGGPMRGVYELKGKACCTEPAVQNSRFTQTPMTPGHRSTNAGAGFLDQLEENLWRNAERVMRVKEGDVQLRLLQQGLANTPYDTHSPESQLWTVIQGGISDDTYTV